VELFYDRLHSVDSVVGRGTTLEPERSRFPFPMRSLDFFNLPDTSSRNISPGGGGTQSLTEMSNRNLTGGKGRSTRKSDKFTDFCEPTD
jgi:hypothetical protein